MREKCPPYLRVLISSLSLGLGLGLGLGFQLTLADPVYAALRLGALRIHKTGLTGLESI